MNRLQQQLEEEAMNTEQMEALLAAAGTENTEGDNEEVSASPIPTTVAPTPSPDLSPVHDPDEMSHRAQTPNNKVRWEMTKVNVVSA